MTNSIFSPLSNPQVHRQVLAARDPDGVVEHYCSIARFGRCGGDWSSRPRLVFGRCCVGQYHDQRDILAAWFFAYVDYWVGGAVYGGEDRKQLALVFMQGSLMALLFALVFLIAHNPIADLIFGWSDASAEVKHYGMQYFSIRVWSAPAALMNFVLLGWLLGTQNSKAPMWMVIITNVTNIALDLLFVMGLGWKVEGAALASVIADYSGMAFGFGLRVEDMASTSVAVTQAIC